MSKIHSERLSDALLIFQFTVKMRRTWGWRRWGPAIRGILWRTLGVRNKKLGGWGECAVAAIPVWASEQRPDGLLPPSPIWDEIVVAADWWRPGYNEIVVG